LSLAAFARSPNQKTFLLPVEATGVIGALAGIGEIARQTFGSDAPGAPPAPRRPSGTVPVTGYPGPGEEGGGG